MTFLRLQYKPTRTSRVWRNASLTMHPEGIDNMIKTALALLEQEGWSYWRIVDDGTETIRAGYGYKG